MKTLRNYQARAVADCIASLAKHRRTLLVMPTSAGKSFTAQRIAEQVSISPLWLVNRTELADQAPGRAVTVQSLLSGDRPPCDLLIVDEAHYFAPGAPEWHAVADHYPRILGLTATASRGDGTPLGDLFNDLVTGAQYSELIEGDYIMEPRVVRPSEELEGLAQDPAQAWKHFAGSRPGFAYFSRTELADKFAAKMNAGQLLPCCAVIHGEMDKDLRRETIARFKLGKLQILANCQTLVAGINVPRAEICLIARGCQHEGTYIQMAGRVMRTNPGKERPLVLDLGGCSHRLGLPHSDRDYFLTGTPIRRRDAEAIQQCAECGAVYAPAPCCPECGAVPAVKPASVRIWNVALEEIGAEQFQAMTPDQRGKLTWKQKMMDDDAARLEWLRKKAKHPGHAAAMHASMFGGPMPRAWWGALKRGR